MFKISLPNRILSSLLAIVLVVGLTPSIAWAGEEKYSDESELAMLSMQIDGVLQLDEPVDINVSNDVFYAFTPTTTDTYVFTSSGTASPAINIYSDAEMNDWIGFNVYGGTNGFKLVIELTAGHTYYVKLERYNSVETACQVQVVRRPTEQEIVKTELQLDADPVPLSFNDQGIVKFTAPYAGMYAFNFPGSCELLCEFYADCYGEHRSGSIARTNYANYGLNKGESLYLYLSPLSQDSSFSGDISVRSLSEYGELFLDEPVSTSGVATYAFTAPEQGRYVFTSISDKVTSGSLYADGDRHQQYASDAGSSNGNNNFEITFRMTEGQTVFLQVRQDGEGDYQIVARRAGYTYTELMFPMVKEVAVNVADDPVIALTAPGSGAYTFVGEAGYRSVYGTLYSDRDCTQQIAESQVSYESDCVFTLTQNLVKDQTVYLRIADSERRTSSSCTVKVSYISDGTDELHIDGALGMGSNNVTLGTGVLYSFTAPSDGTYHFVTDRIGTEAVLYYDSGLTERVNSAGTEYGFVDLFYVMYRGQTVYLTLRPYRSSYPTEVDFSVSKPYELNGPTALKLNEESSLRSVARFSFTANATGTYSLTGKCTNPLKKVDGILYSDAELSNEITADKSLTEDGHFCFNLQMASGQTVYLKAIVSGAPGFFDEGYVIVTSEDGSGVNVPIDGDLVLEQPKTFNNADRPVYRFTAPAADDYSVYLSTDGFATIDLFSDPDLQTRLAHDYTTSSEGIVRVNKYGLAAGESVYISVYPTNYDEADCTLTAIRYSDAATKAPRATVTGSISPGESIDVLSVFRPLYSFTAPKDGTYRFYSTGDSNTSGVLYSSDITVSENRISLDYASNFSIKCDLPAGKTVYCQVIKGQPGGECKLCVEEAISEPIRKLDLNVAQDITISDEPVLSFTAPVDGTYAFTTISNDDTYGHLYSDSALSNQVRSNDDNGEGMNFKIEYELMAGQTVYLKARPFRSGTSFPCQVIVTTDAIIPDPEPMFTRGDVNGNGVINIVDAQIAYDIATGIYGPDGNDLPEGLIAQAADVTGPNGVFDGTVDAQDARAIQYRAITGVWEADNPS